MYHVLVLLGILNTAYHTVPEWLQTQSPSDSQAGPENEFSLCDHGHRFQGKQFFPSFLPSIDVFQETTELQL